MNGPIPRREVSVTHIIRNSNNSDSHNPNTPHGQSNGNVREPGHAPAPLVAIVIVLALALLTIATSVLAGGTPLGSSFTYQGVLKQSGSPVSGTYDFQFSLWDSSSGSLQVSGAVTRLGVNVDAGQFKADLDFGASVFQGDERWLKIAVRPAEPTEGGSGGSGGPYTDLYPLQRISPTPYALHSLNPGPQGPPGPQGVVTSGFGSGFIGSIPVGPNWTFAGPYSTVTLQPGQRIIAWASAPLGLSTLGATQDFEIDVGWQWGTGGSVTNASGSGYMVGQATSVRLIYPANGVLNPGPGTWRIGVVVRNGIGPNPLNKTDYVNFSYMIVNQ